MDLPLCVEPLLTEIFDLRRFPSLEAVMELCLVGPDFHTHFQSHERGIYLAFLGRRVELVEWDALSLEELRQLLVRAPEFFDVSVDVPREVVAVLDSPKLFLLTLPHLQGEKASINLVMHACKHDSHLTYAAVLVSCPEVFNLNVLLIQMLIQYDSPKCREELFRLAPTKLYYSMTRSAKCSDNNSLAKLLMVNYCQRTNQPLDHLLAQVMITDILEYPTNSNGLGDYEDFIAWILTQDIDASFHANPYYYLTAASVSEKTFAQLFEKFPDFFADADWRQQLTQDLCQFVSGFICMKGQFRECLHKMERHGLLTRENVGTIKTQNRDYVLAEEDQ